MEAAAPRLLGKDAAGILTPPTRDQLVAILADAERVRRLQRDMAEAFRGTEDAIAEAAITHHDRSPELTCFVSGFIRGRVDSPLRAHPPSSVTASACASSSQKRISISQYSAAAPARCSRARAASPASR
jgi:hypothetical protein